MILDVARHLPVAQDNTVVVYSAVFALHAGKNQRVELIGWLGIRSSGLPVLNKVRIQRIVMQLVRRVVDLDIRPAGRPRAQRRKPMGFPQPSTKTSSRRRRNRAISLPVNIVLASGMAVITHMYRHLACWWSATGFCGSPLYFAW